MVIAGLVLAGLAALFHVYVFYLESLAWSSERTRAAFGNSVGVASVTKPLAFNQCFPHASPVKPYSPAKNPMTDKRGCWTT